MHIFHNWSKWREYIVNKIIYPGQGYPEIMQNKPIPTTETWQRRECIKCGYIQQERVFK